MQRNRQYYKHLHLAANRTAGRLKAEEGESRALHFQFGIAGVFHFDIRVTDCFINCRAFLPCSVTGRYTRLPLLRKGFSRCNLSPASSLHSARKN